MTASQVVSVDPRHDGRWERLSRGARGSLFTSPPWLRAVCDTYRFEPRARLVLADDGTSTGGFAWVEVSDVRGRRLLGLPFSDRGDPVVDDLATWRLCSAEARSQGAPLTVRALAPTPACDDPELSEVGEAAWHGTPLHTTLDELHRRLGGSARRNLGAARRAGVRVVVDRGLDAVRRFHALHVGLRKGKYRLLAQPVELFERIWAEFADADGVVVLLACLDGEPVAGALLLEWAGTLYYKFGASVPGQLAARPNDAVFWAALQHGLDRGAGLLDWGLSDLDQPGLVAYKRKWASVERRIVTLRTAGDAAAPSPEIGGVLAGLTELLTRDDVPDEVTARAGALLYRYFC